MNWIRKNIDLIIIVALIIISAIGLYKKYDYNVPILARNYIAYFTLFGLLILRFIKIKKVKTILGLLLIIGSFNLIQFTHSDIFISFYLGKVTFIGFQPVSFLCLIALVLVDFKGAKTRIKSIIPEQTEAESLASQDNMIDKYKAKYEKFSKEDLVEIIDNPSSYQDYAVEAARLLLEDDEKRVTTSYK